MPRKGNQSGGKPLFDLKNLEQAQKLIDLIFEKSKNVTANFNATKNTEQYIEQMIEVRDLYKDLSKYVSGGSKLTQYDNSQKYQEEMVYLEKILKAQKESIEYEAKRQVAIEETKNKLQEQTREAEKAEKDIEATSKKLKEYSTNWEKQQSNFKLNNLGDTFFNSKIRQAQEKSQPQKDALVDSIIEKHKKDGTLNAANEKKIQGEINKSLSNFNDGTKKYKMGAALLNVAGETLKAGIDKLFSLFTAGLHKQTEIYEKTFQNISTRTGTTRSTYYSKQAGLNNQLSSLGLNDNVGTTEIQEMWNSLASIGANENTMFERALDNVITKNIVPYLDTTSQSVNLLDSRLNGAFIKDIRGINRANLEIAGNNYATQDLLQTIIDEVQPMSDKALEDLAQGSEEVTAMINSLIDKRI